MHFFVGLFRNQHFSTIFKLLLYPKCITYNSNLVFHMRDLLCNMLYFEMYVFYVANIFINLFRDFQVADSSLYLLIFYDKTQYFLHYFH